MRSPDRSAIVPALALLAGLLPSLAAARPPLDDTAKVVTAAEAARIGRTDPAREAVARMTLAKTLMVTDPPAAAAMVEAARAASVRAEGEGGAMVALADYRLALVRALGGDRAGQLRPMAAAAGRIAERARTPDQRTLAGQALIVAASFTMSSGEPAMTDRLRDAAVAMLARPDLARTGDLAEAFRVVADVFVFQDRAADALAWADRAVTLYRALDPDDPALVYALARRGSALLRLSRYPEALADLRGAVAQSDRVRADDPTVSIIALRALGNYYWRLAEPDLALPLLKRALAEAAKLPPGFPYAGGLSRDIMNTLLDADRPHEARAYAEQTAATTRATMGATSYEYASALLLLARIDTAEGAFDAAASRIAAADAIFAQTLVTNNDRRFEPLAARAALYRATRRHTEAAALYDRASATLARLPSDDLDRIDMAEGSAAARLGGGSGSAAGWNAARAAAEGLTVRIIRQGSGVGAIDTARSRSARVFGTALDTAWDRLRR